VSDKKESNEISTEEQIKRLETKADKVDTLLTLNLCISMFGCGIFMFFQVFFGWITYVIAIFFGIYGILNWIILSKD
jgi:hypothetical protein